MSTLLQHKWMIVVGALVLLASLLALMSWLRPGVPKDVVIVAGAEGSRSHDWAIRYAEYARDHGVQGKVVATPGSREVLSRLSGLEHGDARRTLGFAQSGAEHTQGDSSSASDLQSLGSLYFEPIWVIVRADASIEDVADLEGKRVYWGHSGSEARAASAKIIDVYGLKPLAEDEVDGWTPDEAARALVDGRLDAGVFVGPSDIVRRLLIDDSLEPLSAKHSEVFTRINPDVGAIHVPQGLFSLAEMIPREDLVVMAPAMNLVAAEGLHPAIVDLFLDAATRFHSRATPFSKHGEFPSDRFTSLPVNEDALHYFKKGPSGFRKYLPFWLASLMDQLVNVGLPFFVVLSTVFKGVPVYLEWKLKLQLTKFWKQLAAIEKQPERDLDETLAKLASIEAESAKLRVPAMRLPSYFELRQEIHDMRDRLESGW